MNNNVYLLSRMLFRAQHVGYFPMLPSSVQHAIAWGKGLPNMSSQKGLHKEEGELATKDFLHMAGIRAEYVMKIDPSGVGESEILNVHKKHFVKAAYQETFSNFIYTIDPSITLLAKPGDCPVAIISTTLSDGKPLVGLLHAGRMQLDAKVPMQTITFLQSLGCDVIHLSIGIAPSIAKSVYFIQEKDASLLRHLQDWQSHQRAEFHEDKIYLDLLGYFIDQLHESGVPLESIEAYTLDTFTAAKQGESFSQRYASITGKEENNGRFLVAVQLK